MAQDCMEVYLKDGTCRKFYLEDVTEIATTNVDTEGVRYSEYQFQHIKEDYRDFIYSLEDIDSITFTKYDEEIAENNLSLVMSALSPILNKSNTIDEIKENINAIKGSEGVEEVWCSNNDLFVKVEGWETMAFHLNHDEGSFLSSINKTRTIDNLKDALARMKSTIKPDGSKLKVVIANQQHNDEFPYRYNCRENLFIPIVSELNNNNIDATYVDNPNLDFFYSDIYNFDIVFLITHGGYDQQSGIHSFITSDELGTVEFESEEIGPAAWRQQLWRDRLWWYRRKTKYKGATNQHFFLNWVKEIREGKELWVAYPSVTELFFKEYSQGNFSNSNSVLFNGACQSLMGNDENGSFNMAEIFKEHNLGVYIGYTESNSCGQICGTTFLTHLFSGKSIERAYNDLENATFNFDNLKGNYHKEDHTEFNKDGTIKKQWTALLKMYPEQSELPNPIFLFPTVTVEKSQDSFNKEYSQGETVVLEGITTAFDISKNDVIRNMEVTDNTQNDIKYGFEYGTNQYIQNRKIDANISPASFPSNDGNLLFKATLTSLEPEKTYYYRAYTYDGENYNFGKRQSFKIEKLADLTLSNSSPINLKVGESTTVEITAGSGEYGVTNLNSDKAKATLQGTTITIEALAVGEAKIVVTDMKTGQKIIIEVSVTNFQLSATKLSLVEGSSGTVEITAGSGEYGVTNLDSDKAKATLQGTTITIEALAVGEAKVVVTDMKTGQKIIIEVTVTQKAADLQLSSTKLSLVEGNSGTVEITAGSGEYGVTNLNSDKAKATLNSTTITIEALAVGDAKIVVTDMKTGQKIIIEVTVTQGATYPDIALSSQEVYLNVGDTEQIEVISGSGSYSVWVYAPEVANVTISGKTITIKALSLGSTVVKVTDEVTQKTITFGIAVIPPSAYDKYAVDLGLSVKWSQMNVGAVSVEDWGEHYAWGETESKSYFSWSSYDFCNGTESTITKYNSHDGKTTLEPSDDAATVVMGRNWRTPTLTEMQELVNRCKWTQETMNGVNGMRVTGPNGNSIFLPYGGEMFDDVLSHDGEVGYYYVSTLSSEGEKYAPALVCLGNKVEFVNYARYYGLSIRPVFTKK